VALSENTISIVAALIRDGRGRALLMRKRCRSRR
jgi:hypothetical protein